MNYKELIEKEIEYLRKIPTERVNDITDTVFRNLKSGRVITSGMGKAGQIAHTFATTLSSTGTPAFFLHPSEAQHGDLGIICPGDIIFIFSNSGKTREILELMQILNLDPEGQNILCPFDRVVIATDQDPDGAHITSLLINLFYLWFPWMITQGRIQFLETPLVTIGDKSKKYFYSLDEFKKGTGKSDKGNVRYLKGLGSLSLEDWDYVMKNKRITVLIEDKKTKYHLDMAFGKSAMERKKWLSSVV